MNPRTTTGHWPRVRPTPPASPAVITRSDPLSTRCQPMRPCNPPAPPVRLTVPTPISCHSLNHIWRTP